jgi:hypothetical protein
MTTLKEFEDALREQGMNMALAILEQLRARDRSTRSAAPPRRVRGAKMTPELARKILELHSTTNMTQQEIAFQLGVNQGRVNEVVKRGKWLSDDPKAPEAIERDRALARARTMSRRARSVPRPSPSEKRSSAGRPARARPDEGQLKLGEF